MELFCFLSADTIINFITILGSLNCYNAPHIHIATFYLQHVFSIPCLQTKTTSPKLIHDSFQNTPSLNNVANTN